ncbi:hypothetical protein GCM10022237_09110 [Nocardioides ginsengisoli]|uniref:ATP-binding protein n=1 Tax=Nocardioides ginsengisoli TaxID=363868 RepID=UPI00338A4483
MALPAEPLLLGRDGVRERLTDRIGRAAAGQGGLVWVSGEAGIGKTRILGEARRIATAHGFRVLHGTGWDDPGTPPFWLWVQVLRDVPGGREALAPGVDRFALFESVAATLDRLADGAPVLVVLDDLHWTDAGSLRLLGFVERTLAHRPVLVVAGWRDHEAAPDPAIAELAAELATCAEPVPLTGLDADAVRELVRAEGGVVLSADEADAVRERSGGNPLFVGELARLAADRGNAAVLAEVPGSAVAVIRRRLGRVSQPCHELLVAAAVAGTASSLDVVQRLTGQPPATVAALLDEAVAAGLARDVGGRVELPHPLVRAAVAGSVPATRVRELHRAVAALLADRLDGDPTAAAEVAQHLHRALPLVPAEEAVAMSRRAADAAMDRMAYEEAAEHLTAALAACPPADDVRRRILLDRGAAVLAYDDLDAARADFLESARLARAAGDAEGLAEAALGFAAGQAGFEIRLWDRAQLDLLEEALAALGDADSVTRAHLLARLSVAASFSGTPARRTELAEEAVALARRLGDPRAIAHALAARCDIIAGPAHSERREADAGEVVDRARAAGDRGLELLGLRLRIVALLEQGRTTAARADMSAFEAAASALRQPIYSWYVPLFRGFVAHLEGDLALVRQCADEAERIGRRAGSHNAVILASVQRSWIAIETDQEEEILRELRGLIEVFAETAPAGQGFVSLFPGQPRVARAAALPSIAAAVASLEDDAEMVSNLCLLAIAALRYDDPPAAAAVVRRALEPWSHRFGVDGIAAGAIGPVSRLVGELALLEGDLDAAETHLKQAEAAAAASGAVLAGVHVREAQAALARAREAVDVQPVEAPNRFRRDGDLWQVAFAGTAAVVRHVKGMSDLQVLLARPGSETHALDLAGAPGGAPPEGDTGPVLDEQARAAYKRRLAELDDDIDRAAVDGDADARTQAEEERAFLVAELGAAYGLGGRARRTGAAAERARSAVTWRIRDAIRRIEEVHPALGAHLGRSVRTGSFCRYDPEQPVSWET